MRCMDSHHHIRHSKQQATQAMAVTGVALVLFGIYVAFAFAGSYYEKSVTLLSQLPIKQQSITTAAKNLEKRATAPVRSRSAKPSLGNRYNADLAVDEDAKIDLELRQYSVDNQATLLIFSFAMYKIAIIVACSLMFIGGLMIWTSYHVWWSFTKKHDAASAARSAVTRPVAVVRRKTSR